MKRKGGIFKPSILEMFVGDDEGMKNSRTSLKGIGETRKQHTPKGNKACPQVRGDAENRSEKTTKLGCSPRSFASVST